MATPVPKTPRPPAPETLEQRFRRLASEWKAATQFLSDADRIIGHAAFQEIIALGPEVVPLLLRELQASPGLWVWALPAITGEDPVPAADRGNIRKMSEVWVNWGRQKGIR